MCLFISGARPCVPTSSTLHTSDKYGSPSLKPEGVWGGGREVGVPEGRSPPPRKDDVARMCRWFVHNRNVDIRGGDWYGCPQQNVVIKTMIS